MLIKGVPLATKSRSLRVRPDLDFSSITAQGKPTFVTIGAISGYSLPIYNNDNEELFFRFSIPRRWDGASIVEYAAQHRHPSFLDGERRSAAGSIDRQGGAV